VNLISTAKKSIIIQVENLGDDHIQKALIAVVKKGISVRIIVPMCSKNFNPKLNYAPLKELTAAGIKAKVMPEPETASKPYMHSKMMIIDGVSAYVGSVNFSKNSTTQARELGILFSESIPIKKMSEIFEQDWISSITVPNEDSVSCSYF
jgi:cardiolipin synthase A/B